MNEINELKQLIEIIDRLLAPGGCPWDREQTLMSLRTNLLEETTEVIEAIDLNDSHHIEEELGDLCFNVLFLCRIAEKEKHSNMTKVLQGISEKLIRRHPHVFGDAQIDSSDAVIKQWNEIKQKEKGKEHRKSALDGIPKQLPALARAQKIIKKMHKEEFKFPKKERSLKDIHDESSLGELLMSIVAEASSKGLDAEHALRKALTHSEKEFRTFEAHRKTES
jgi:tetrapyrrole methylase family protein/MazG family protein